MINRGCKKDHQPVFILFIILLSLSLFNCQEKEADHRDFQVLFTVNDIETSVHEFESNYVKYLISNGKNDTKEERYRFLNQMIDNLVLAEAAAERGYTGNPTYIAAREYQERKSMLDFYFMDEMNKSMEPPTDDELRLAYAKRERKVYVRHLFSKDQDKLSAYYQKLEQGESFVDVANEFYNTSEYDSLAGYLGPISYFGEDDAFAEAAYSTNQGDYTKPVKSIHGYHIIYVEFIEFPAILAEDEYQYRKQGVESQVRLRRQKLLSNNYISDLMSTLNVQGDAEAIMALKEAVNNLDGEGITAKQPDSDQPDDFWSDQRVDQLENILDPEEVLLTYVLGGTSREFTNADYLKWLPYLSFIESSNRTGASVGRGLRNEVLYQLAEKNDYSTDERVNLRVEKRGYKVLSELFQYELAQSAINDTSEITVPESFRDRLLSNNIVELKASYWKIQTDNLKEAERIKEDIENGGLPLSYDNYISQDYTGILPTNPDYELLKDAITNTPLLAHSAQEGWMVLFVNNKELSVISKSTPDSDLSTRYKIYRNINVTIEQLREKADIEIDTTLFDEIYNIWDLKNNTEKATTSS